MRGLHAMVDIEALGNPDRGSSGCIVSIGATAWAVGESEHPTPPDIKALVNIANQPGRLLDGKTVLWWMRQSKEAQDASFAKGLPRFGLRDALVALYNWGREVDHWWAWPAAYDLSTLSDAYRQYDMQPPWSYRDLNCARTLCRALGVKRRHNPKKHDPLEDARVQAEAVVEALSRV